MMRLASIIKIFEADFLHQYGSKLLPSQGRALAAFKTCRNALSAQMKVQCSDCHDTRFVPHSCGHRNCPHCQAHESQQWIERQLAKQLPCDYFMITFTLPEQWRQLAWQNQKIVYNLITQCAYETVNTFSQNDKRLQGNAGAVTVAAHFAKGLSSRTKLWFLACQQQTLDRAAATPAQNHPDAVPTETTSGIKLHLLWRCNGYCPNTDQYIPAAKTGSNG